MSSTAYKKKREYLLSNENLYKTSIYLRLRANDSHRLLKTITG